MNLILRDAYACVSTTPGVLNYAECNCTKNACALLLRILSIVNSDWLQHARSVGRVYECPITFSYFHCEVLQKICNIFQSLLECFNIMSLKA